MKYVITYLGIFSPQRPQPPFLCIFFTTNNYPWLSSNRQNFFHFLVYLSFFCPWKQQKENWLKTFLILPQINKLSLLFISSSLNCPCPHVDPKAILGVIQQLHNPNFSEFRPLTPLNGQFRILYTCPPWMDNFGHYKLPFTHITKHGLCIGHLLELPPTYLLLSTYLKNDP